MNSITKKEFNGIEVAFKGTEEVNLTDLWKAVGSPDYKDPEHWTRLDNTQELINAATRFLNTLPEGILKTKRGKGGGTWTHRIVAVSYAGYLSADLQVWINEIFLERLKEEANPDLIGERFADTYKRRGYSDRRIKLRFDSIQSNKQHRDTLMQHEVDKAGQIMCANNINVGILRVQKKTYLAKNGYPLTDPLRDRVNDSELAAITLAEILSDGKIEKDAINGNHDCSKTCFQVARSISDVMINI
jgi:hypothetical protein